MHMRSRASRTVRSRPAQIVQRKTAVPEAEATELPPPSISAQLQATRQGHSLSRISVGGSLAPQAKLAVNQPDDVYEQEADRMADMVMRAPAGPDEQSAAWDSAPELSAPAVQRAPATPVLQRQVATSAPAGQSAPANAPAQTPGDRDTFITGYQTWLEQRYTELAALQGNEKLARARGILSQVEQVSAELIAGRVPQLDQLSTTPAAQDGGQRGYVAPQLIAVVRKFILVTERPIEGVERAQGAVADGSLYEDGNDWNTRLGVPQYRTQSDNLAAPEATCNVTSSAMVMERLGHGRADLLAAIEVQLRRSYLTTREGREALQGHQPEEVAVPETYWTSEATRYLNTVNNDTANYRKIRGNHLIDRTTTVASVAADFKNDAQPEDLLDFLVFLNSMSRYAITSSTVNAQTLIDAVSGNGDPAITVEQVARGSRTWAQAKQSAKTCLEGGGAAVVSFYHKGRGETGTHIIAIQSVTSNGIMVDDPYGQVNPTYRRNQTGDAYADTGQTTRSAERKNQPDYTDRNDWRVENTRSLSDNESRGNSYEISDEVMEGAWTYITLWQRQQEQVAQPAAPGR